MNHKPTSIKFIAIFFFVVGTLYLLTLPMQIWTLFHYDQFKKQMVSLLASVIPSSVIGILSIFAAYKFEKGYRWTRYAFYVLAILFIVNVMIGEIAWAKAGNKALSLDPISIAEIIGSVWVLITLHRPSIVSWCRN